MTKQEHSPLPWKLNPKNGRVILSDGEPIITCRAKGTQAWNDSDFILHAANSHEALVEALSEMVLDYGHTRQSRAVLSLAGEPT